MELFRTQQPSAGTASTLLTGPTFASIQQGYHNQLKAWHATWTRRSSYRASFSEERFREQLSHIEFYYSACGAKQSR